MRNLFKRNKRRSFGSIFLRHLAAALVVSCLLIYAFFVAGSEALFNSAVESRDEFFNSISNSISLNERDKKPNYSNFRLTFYSGFYTLTESFVDSSLFQRFGYPLNDRCYGAGAIIDNDGNVLLDNHDKLLASIKLAKDDERNGMYVCDFSALDIPELNEFYAKRTSFPRTVQYSYSISVSSAYIDNKTFEFIPHELCLSIVDAKSNVISEDNYSINCDDPRFELVELKRSGEDKYPRSMTLLGGERKEIVQQALSERTIPDNLTVGEEMQEVNSVERVYDKKEQIVYNGEKAYLYSKIRVNIDNALNRFIFLLGSGAILFVMVLIALLLSWRRHTINKTDCAMEDYQRSITNNLAHDVKTPLAAIGGYAENLGEMIRDSADEKQQRYVQSIIDNVAYVDSVVNRALKLNQIGQTEKLKKTDISLRSLVDMSVERYRSQIDDRGISFKSDGDTQINAEKDMMISAIDNLIANAVKYTRNDGEIKVTIEKKRLRIVNTVSEKVDTKDLTKPFVKGDKARSDRNSSGLGLSIAEASLERNGYRLRIACTNDQFTADILL